MEHAISVQPHPGEIERGRDLVDPVPLRGRRALHPTARDPFVISIRFAGCQRMPAPTRSSNMRIPDRAPLAIRASRYAWVPNHSMPRDSLGYVEYATPISTPTSLVMRISAFAAATRNARTTTAAPNRTGSVGATRAPA